MSQAQIPVIFENAAKEKNRYLHTSFYNLKKENAEFLHYHDVLELGLCLSGRGECLTADGSYPFSKGDGAPTGFSCECRFLSRKTSLGTDHDRYV